METGGETKNVPWLSIPHDLVTDILSRLPVKSLCRFRSVSVLWNCTISDQSFAKSHYNHSSLSRSDGTSLIITFYDSSAHRLSVYAVDHRESHDLVAANLLTEFTVSTFANYYVSESVYGLICVQTASKSLFTIFNPSTREHITLPKREKASHWNEYHSRTCFGYDPMKNEHKVLSMFVGFALAQAAWEVVMENKVFVLGGDRSWKNISVDPPHFPHSESICFNGVIYYKAWTGYGSGRVDRVLIAFDVQLETFRCIQMPPGLMHHPLQYCDALVEYDQRPAIIIYHSLKPLNRIEIWVLTTEVSQKSNWIHKIIVQSSTWTDIVWDYSLVAKTLRNGEIIIHQRKLNTPFYLFYLNLKCASLRRVEICCTPDYRRGYHDDLAVTDHVESILSLSHSYGC